MKKGKKGKRLEGARERQRNNGSGEKRKRDGCLAKNMDILKGVIIQHLMEISFYFSHTCGGSVAKSCPTLVSSCGVQASHRSGFSSRLFVTESPGKPDPFFFF